MELLKKRILRDGIVIENRILKVDSFLNHQMDIRLFNEMGEEFRNRFKHKVITKILTVEASGIGIACIVAQHFDNVPVIFAKKHNATNLDKDTYEAEIYSFTKEKTYKIRVSKKYINSDDKVLIIDDFLASGSAAVGLIDVIRQAGAEVAGMGIVIEKSFQGGRKIIEECGVELQSLAIIDSMTNNTVNFK